MLNKLVLPGILVLGFILRLININQSLWLDEATSVLNATNLTFSQIITKFSPGDFHPPLYYLMLKIWIFGFGSSEVAVRFLSLLLAVGTVYLIFLIGKELFNEKIGLIASLFMATAPLHIYYSQEARMYVPATFFACCAMLFFLKEILTGKIKNLILFLVFSILLIYTDYPPIFLLLTLVFYLIIYERQHLKKWLLPLIFIFLAFLPWMPIFFAQIANAVSISANAPIWWQTLGRTNFKEIFLVPIKFSIGRVSFPNKIIYASIVFVTWLIFFNGIFNGLKEYKKTKILWFWLIIPLGIAMIGGIFGSGFSYFRLLFTLPAFYLILAYGIAQSKQSNFLILLITFLNLIFALIYLFNPKFHREDWRSATSWIESHSGSKSAAIFVSKNQRDPYLYYSKKIPGYGPNVLETGNFDTIWLIRYVQPILDPKDTLRAKIERAGYIKKEEKDFNGVVTWQYSK